MQNNVWRGHHQAPRRSEEEHQTQQQQTMQYGFNSHQQQQALQQHQQMMQHQQQQQQQAPVQPQQHQQQPQQQQQQQPAVDANGNPVQVASVMGDGSSQSGSQNPPMNLASVLHYLQSEWRRWERDRNEWEIERAEMRARIALLEGERRSAENLKTDLMRRVKMLEFALRQERSKTLSSSSSSAGNHNGTLAHSKLTSLINEDKAMNEKDKESGGSAGSGGDSPKSAGGNLPNGRALKSEITNGGTWSGANNPWKGAAGVPSRDGKSRARSRDYLKQCLQEISYLTSSAALNPLPNKLAFDLSLPASTSAEGKKETKDAQPDESSKPVPLMDVPPRPKKTLDEEPLKPKAEDPTESKSDAPTDSSEEKQTNPSGTQTAATQGQDTDEEVKNGSASSASTDSSLNGTVNRSPSDWVGISGSSSSSEQEKGTDDVLTAIYKPESKEVWKKALQAANEQAEKAQRDAKSRMESGTLPADSAMTIGTDHGLDSLAEAGEVAALAKRHWNQSRQLKSHLCTVRNIKFSPNGDTVISGSTDNTVKIWKLDFASLAANKNAGAGLELEPQITFRGHTSAVTSLAVSYTGIIFSGSLDATIRSWRAPGPEYDTYSAYDPSLTLETLVGHTDSVWDLALLPSREHEQGYLLSASADGTIKVWDTSPLYTNAKGFRLLKSWSYSGLQGPRGDKADEPIPLSIAPYHPDYRIVLVGFNNGKIKAFNIESGAAVMTFGAELDDLSPCNQVLCHPTLDIIIAAHDDGKLRLYDQNARLTSTIVAHTDAINAIDIDPNSSSTLVSGGDDCSCKIWDITTGTCSQDWTHHRLRTDQGVLAVKFCDKVPVLTTGGADGVLRVYVKST